jgi:putative transposase
MVHKTWVADDVLRGNYAIGKLAQMETSEGKRMNLKKLYRLYREERLTVRRRGGRKRAFRTRAPMPIPEEARQRRSHADRTEPALPY